jgi:hypothetical protein
MDQEQLLQSLIVKATDNTHKYHSKILINSKKKEMSTIIKNNK